MTKVFRGEPSLKGMEEPAAAVEHSAGSVPTCLSVLFNKADDLIYEVAALEERLGAVLSDDVRTRSGCADLEAACSLSANINNATARIFHCIEALSELRRRLQL